MNENSNVISIIVVQNTSVMKRLNSGILPTGILGFWTSTDVSCSSVNRKRKDKAQSSVASDHKPQVLLRWKYFLNYTQ